MDTSAPLTLTKPSDTELVTTLATRLGVPAAPFTTSMSAAMAALHAAKATYSISGNEIHTNVTCIADSTNLASGRDKNPARAVTLALLRALGVTINEE